MLERRPSRVDTDVAAEYARLIEARKLTPCTPEEQAGPDATQCPTCHRLTLHQHTGEPMCGCKLTD